MKQSTVNIIVILGVVIMALGAWTMPMYTAGLNRAAFDTIGNQLTETQNDISDVSADISGGGLDGGLDVASLGATTADQSTLQKALGTNFNTFSNKFIKQDSSASQFQTVEVKTFDPAKPRFKFPNNLVGLAVTEQNGAGIDTPATSTCVANGTVFDADGTTGAPVVPLSANEPSSIFGFALQAPAVATQIIEIQICLDPQGIVIIDELIQLTTSQVFTKNFAYGIIPPNQALKVLIHDVPNAGGAYKVWIFRENPIVQPIRIINDVGGGLAGLGTQCTSIAVNVRDGSNANAGAGAPINGANVKLNHSFMPLISTKFSADPDGAGPLDGRATFSPADFGGVMPPGLYFVDVIPPPAAAAALPFHAQIQCPASPPDPNEDADANANTRLVTARLATATQFAATVGGGSTAGALTVNIKDQSGAPLTNAFVKINAQFAPIMIQVCDGIGSVCTNPETGAAAGDNVPAGALTDAAGDGTFNLANLPLPGPSGGYGIGACKVIGGTPQCIFQPVNLTAAATTVNLTIFVPP